MRLGVVKFCFPKDRSVGVSRIGWEIELNSLILLLEAHRLGELLRLPMAATTPMLAVKRRNTKQMRKGVCCAREEKGPGACFQAGSG